MHPALITNVSVNIDAFRRHQNEYIQNSIFKTHTGSQVFTASTILNFNGPLMVNYEWSACLQEQPWNQRLLQHVHVSKYPPSPICITRSPILTPLLCKINMGLSKSLNLIKKIWFPNLRSQLPSNQDSWKQRKADTPPIPHPVTVFSWIFIGNQKKWISSQ